MCVPVGFPGGTNGKESACQRERRKKGSLNSRIGKIPWGKTWQPIPVFWPRESPGQRSLAGYKSIGSQRVGHD